VYALQITPGAATTALEAARSQARLLIIEVLGGQTLQQLRRAILRGLGRPEDWLELAFDDSSHHSTSICYVSATSSENDPFDAGEPIGDIAETSISSLCRQLSQSLACWFDLWDDRPYVIQVMNVHDPEAGVEYPRIVATV
jgi:hypothetical protein